MDSTTEAPVLSAEASRALVTDLSEILARAAANKAELINRLLQDKEAILLRAVDMEKKTKDDLAENSRSLALVGYKRPRKPREAKVPGAPKPKRPRKVKAATP